MNAPNKRFRFLGPLARISNLDAVFFWSVYCLSVIFILWLFCNSFRTHLGIAMQQQIVSLVQTTSAFTRYAPSDGEKRYAYLDVIQKEHRDLKAILIVRMEGYVIRLLHESRGVTASDEDSIDGDLLENPTLRIAVQNAVEKNGTTLSRWEFLQPYWNPFATQGQAGTEVICHPLETDDEDTAAPPVLVMVFDTSSMIDTFKNIDRIGAIMVSLAVLIGTVLAIVARWRGMQREEAIEERLGTLDLLRQRDRILAMVAAAADDLLLSKEPRPAIQKLMDGLCQFLQLRAAYACLSQGSEPGDSGTAPAFLPLGTLPPKGPLTLEVLRSEQWNEVHQRLLKGNYVVVQGPASERPHLPPLDPEEYLVLFPLLFNRQLSGFVALHWDAGPALPESGVLDCLRLAADLIQSSIEKQESEKKLLHGNKMLALGRMAGGVAHEFNNLLHIITGNLRRLIRHPEAAPDQATLEKILLASDRGARIVQQLLSATRQAPPTFTAAPFNAVIERTLLLGQSAFHKNIELQTRLDPGIPPLPLDEGQIQQVLLNLLINAEYAIRERGTITVTTGLTLAQGAEKSRYAFCEIRDTGVGIGPEALQHMFDPFFTTKPPGSGTGLGLSTSRGILESHGGSLEGRNHPGGGAVFTFYLPLEGKLPLPEAEVLPAPPSLPQEVHGRVWIADDEPLCREFLRAFLGEQQLEVSDFPSGDALLKHAREEACPPQWIITDWSMPGVSGQRLLKELRNLFPNIPLIVTSGFALEPSETAEVDAVMQKPFDPAEILKLMAGLRQGVSAGVGAPS